MPYLPAGGQIESEFPWGSHRPTVILKLQQCLVEKRTKVRSLAVLFSAANWDRSPAGMIGAGHCMRTDYPYFGGQGAERPLDLLTAAQEEKHLV
jgi:hypothetical protein